MTDVQRREAPEAAVVQPSRADHVRRIAALDGLRGFAALIVVLHHSILAVVPALAAPFLSSAVILKTGSLDWWLYDTPLHVIWAGPEAVIVFFVLSGYVLAIPAVKRGAKWLDWSYYPRRLVRLYLPVWGALILAAVLHLAVSRTPITGASWWLNLHPNTLTANAGLKTATLVSQGDIAQYTTVLWSLKYEVLFSLLLPLFLLVALATRNRPRIALLIGGLLLAVTWAAADKNSAVGRYIPVFIIGSLIAFHAESLRLTLQKGIARSTVIAVAGLACVGLITATYMASNTDVSSATGPVEMCPIIGASLALWLALNSLLMEQVLESRAGQWLGTRSYSLYLVHEPIVVAIAFALGGRPEFVLFLALALPASLIAAELFWRCVENPAIRAARRVGAKANTFAWSRRARLSLAG